MGSWDTEAGDYQVFTAGETPVRQKGLFTDEQYRDLINCLTSALTRQTGAFEEERDLGSS